MIDDMNDADEDDNNTMYLLSNEWILNTLSNLVRQVILYPKNSPWIVSWK